MISRLFLSKWVEKGIRFTEVNRMDVLDERNDGPQGGYWKGYLDALIEVREKLRDENE